MNKYLTLALMTALSIPHIIQSNGAEKPALRPVPFNSTDEKVAYICFGAAVGRFGFEVFNEVYNKRFAPRYKCHPVNETVFKAADVTGALILLAGACYLLHRVSPCFSPVFNGDRYGLYYTRTPKSS